MREGKKVKVIFGYRKGEPMFDHGVIVVKDGVEYVDFDDYDGYDDNGVATAPFTPLDNFLAYEIVE